MTEAATIYQCPDCLRLYADGIWKPFPFRAFVPESRACGANDCAAMAADLQQAERDRMARRRRQARPIPPPKRECRQPWKENDEDTRRPQGFSHAQEQSRFVAEGDGTSDCEKMLELLFGPPDTGFRPDDPTRTSRGPWISSHDLKYTHGIETPNSRASQLRGSATLDSHPLVKQFDLDIDCRRNPAEYSVCFKEHSGRRARNE